jgi:threonine aldolase
VKGFGSDNHSGAHPRILKAVELANVAHAPSYGTDAWTEKTNVMFRKLFGENAEAFFVFNGTAANVLALSALIESHHAVLASTVSHLLNDECGAAEKSLGCRVIGVPTPDAKLTPELLKPFLIRRGDQHASQIRAISITQPTELGTVYSIAELKALADFARAERLLLHMDGARLVNAAAALNCELRELTTNIGIDALSLGGTKNGLLFGEAVVFLKKGLAEDFKYKRKQLMQLPSKTRFIAAQFLEFLGADSVEAPHVAPSAAPVNEPSATPAIPLWRQNAKHANAMAQMLRAGLEKSKYCELTQKTQANGVFVKIPRKMVAPLREISFFYVWDEHTFECRLMATWDTTPDDIARFVAAVERIGREVIG